MSKEYYHDALIHAEDHLNNRINTQAIYLRHQLRDLPACVDSERDSREAEINLLEIDICNLVTARDKIKILIAESAFDT